MKLDTVIAGGRVIDPSTGIDECTDIGILEGKISKKKNIKLIKEDILNIDLNRIIQKDSTIFGNLPYNISSQILVKFIKLKNWPPKFNKIIFMFQREVGEKIIANVNSKNYSRLSIITKSRLKVLNYFYSLSFFFLTLS